jgi:hypothetical protein
MRAHTSVRNILQPQQLVSLANGKNPETRTPFPTTSFLAQISVRSAFNALKFEKHNADDIAILEPITDCINPLTGEEFEADNYFADIIAREALSNTIEAAKKGMTPSQEQKSEAMGIRAEPAIDAGVPVASETASETMLAGPATDAPNWIKQVAKKVYSPLDTDAPAAPESTAAPALPATTPAKKSNAATTRKRCGRTKNTQARKRPEKSLEDILKAARKKAKEVHFSFARNTIPAAAKSRHNTAYTVEDYRLMVAYHNARYPTCAMSYSLGRDMIALDQRRSQLGLAQNRSAFRAIPCSRIEEFLDRVVRAEKDYGSPAMRREAEKFFTELTAENKIDAASPLSHDVAPRELLLDTF